MKLFNRNLKAGPLDRQRRKMLQSSTAVAGAVLAPGMAAAVCARHPASVANAVAPDDSIYVEFSDPESNFVDGVLARVSVYNNGEKEIRLSHLSTSDVTTKHGVYDINSRLHRSPVAVGPTGVYHFWLAPTDANVLPANTLASPALSANNKVAKLQLRVVQGENQQVSARHTRLVDATLAYKIS